MGSTKEFAADIAKDILLKVLDNPVALSRKGAGGIPDGTGLAEHIGDCYGTLYKKVLAAITSP